MPSPHRRQRRQRPRGRISETAIEAFRAGDWHGLFRALGLRPWECHPMDVDDDDDPNDPAPPGMTPGYYASWREAIRLRKALKDAIAE